MGPRRCCGSRTTVPGRSRTWWLHSAPSVSPHLHSNPVASSPPILMPISEHFPLLYSESLKFKHNCGCCVFVCVCKIGSHYWINAQSGRRPKVNLGLKAIILLPAPVTLLCPRYLCACQLNREFALNASDTRPHIELINFGDCLLASGLSVGTNHVRVRPSSRIVYCTGSIRRANRIYCYLIINQSSRASCHAWSLQGAHDLGQIAAWPRRRRRRRIRRGGV